ncbi:hypothetical protein BB561_002359 [Smittium simulii]|uniref:Uncharacterized protein n=1 Tax=Smittium simulii TaxID=133385 RepID=A0A2T9YQV2_9FUNG|nr:hypothetical protein BB561_002359 [Smittium simulii]
MEFGLPVSIKELCEPFLSETTLPKKHSELQISPEAILQTPTDTLSKHDPLSFNTKSIDKSWEGKFVRVVGFVKRYFPVEQIAVFEEPVLDERVFSSKLKNVQISVNTEYLGAGKIFVDGLYIIIGQIVKSNRFSQNELLDFNNTDILLEARTVCNVNGLDISSYNTAILAMRKKLDLLLQN